MKSIGIIGSHLIHTYAYAMQFNQPDLTAARRAPAAALPEWQLRIMEAHGSQEPLEGGRLTHVCGGPAGLPETMAAVFGAQVAASAQAVCEVCDVIMVLDEDVPSRSRLAEQALQAGRHVFVDKIVAEDPAQVRRLIRLAQAKGVALDAYSQLGMAQELESVRAMPAGGAAWVTFHVSQAQLPIYAIHAISVVQRAFPGLITKYHPVLKGPGRLGVLENDKGTRIVLALGEDYPKGGVVRVEYCVGERVQSVTTSDKNAMFRRSAQAILNMATGNPPAFTSTQLVEASTLTTAIREAKELIQQENP